MGSFAKILNNSVFSRIGILLTLFLYHILLKCPV